MFRELANAVECLDVACDLDEVAAGFALLDRVTAALTELVGRCDDAGLYDLDGSVSMAAWLRHNCGLSARTAAAICGRARKLRRLPVTTRAWCEGALTGDQVHAITANLKAHTIDSFAGGEGAIIPSLNALNVADTAQVMRAWSAAAAEPGSAPEPERALYLSETLDGRSELSGHLDAEDAAIVGGALRSAMTADGEADPPRRPAQRRADALVDVCRWYLEHRDHPASSRHRPHLNVIVDYDDLVVGQPGRLAHGPILDGPSVRRVACDAGINRVITTGRSTILDYGTTTHTIPPSLYNALVLRDRHCRVPGCDRPSAWCDGHHLRYWSDGGPTCLDNLVLLCRPAPSPDPPTTGLAPQIAARRHRRGHPPRRSPHHQPPTTMNPVGAAVPATAAAVAAEWWARGDKEGTSPMGANPQPGPPACTPRTPAVRFGLPRAHSDTTELTGRRSAGRRRGREEADDRRVAGTHRLAPPGFGHPSGRAPRLVSWKVDPLDISAGLGVAGKDAGRRRNRASAVRPRTQPAAVRPSRNTDLIGLPGH
ncbi:MAG: DUF222 domain-containing protein [Acidimicrobiia bacterium]